MSQLEAIVLAALERRASHALDTDEERRAVAADVAAAIVASPDARRLREFFANAETSGTRLIALVASNGRVQSEVIDAAVRLAGGL
jgi:hypothetical protein